MAQIKGFAIRGVLKYVKESGFPGGIPAIIARLPPEVSPHFANPITASRWYPYEALAGVLETVDRTLGKGDLSLMPELGRKSGSTDFGSIFKVIATIVSLDTIIRRSPIFWQKYCDTGSIECLEVGSGKYRVALKEFPDISRHQCTLIEGWIAGLGLAAGAKAIAVEQVRCVHRGDPWCEYAGTTGSSSSPQ